jgi:hypothetical protein
MTGCPRKKAFFDSLNNAVLVTAARVGMLQNLKSLVWAAARGRAVSRHYE